MSSSVICDIVIPIWNQQELTRRCLDSILRCTKESIRLILIDNGSEEPTRRSLDQFQNDHSERVLLIRNKTNLGYIKGVNQGIRAAQAPWICLLNNDTIATPGWLTEMLKIASADAQIGLVNPTSNSLGFRLGDIPLEEYVQSLKEVSGQTSELSIALGFCLLARRSLFDRVGLLDESFGMGYFEDDDLSRRVKAAGFRCVRACGAYVFHEERGSFRHLPGTREAFQQNKATFEKRWGKRLRIFWSLSDPCAPNKNALTQTALHLASEGHWVYLLASAGMLPPEASTQAQLALCPTHGGPWRMTAAFRLILRRKKPFDLVISDDKTWSAWVKNLKCLHRAELLESPSPDQILDACSDLSFREKR